MNVGFISEAAMRIVFFDCENHYYASALREQLSDFGLIDWSIRQLSQEKISGWAELNSFENAFNVLSGCSSSVGVQFRHPWYYNWPWVVSEAYDTTFFDAMMDNLNDDSIYEVAKYFDFLHLIYLSLINQRFKDIVSNKLSRFPVLPSTVGTINLMNLRYLLEMFSGSMKELSLSLLVFPATFGFYSDIDIRKVLRIICNYAGKQLKKIYLHDFHFYRRQNTVNFVKLFSDRGIEAIEINE